MLLYRYVLQTMELCYWGNDELYLMVKTYGYYLLGYKITT
jgi:hypothetical protein